MLDALLQPPGDLPDEVCIDMAWPADDEKENENENDDIGYVTSTLKMRRLRADHREALAPFLSGETSALTRLCEITFTDLLLRTDSVYWAEVRGLVLVHQAERRFPDGHVAVTCFHPPLVRRGDAEEGPGAIAAVVHAVLRTNPDAMFLHFSTRYLEFAGLADDGALRCDEEFNGEDFLYARDDLVSLDGTSQRRNRRGRARRFEEEHAPVVEEVETSEGFDECCSFVRDVYLDEVEGPGGLGATQRCVREAAFTLRLLRYCASFGSGGALAADDDDDAAAAAAAPEVRVLCVRVDGALAAFAVTEALDGGRTLLVHCEKASRRLFGAYQFINRETARRLAVPGVTQFVNRECAREPRLRQAKKAYGPCELISKWGVTLRSAGRGPIDKELSRSRSQK